MSRPTVDRVLAAAGVQFAYLFGSRVTGQHRPTSGRTAITFYAG